MNKINASPQAMLIVRLAAAQAPLHWQLFAPGEPHHEASGRWPTDDASPFPALAEQYPAWVLIPASDCAFHSLTLPAGLRKPPLQVAPFCWKSSWQTMWKPPILLCSTASRPSARSSPYSGKKCATGWRAANRSPYSPWR